MSNTLRTNDTERIGRAIFRGENFKTNGALSGAAGPNYESGRLSMAADLDRWRAERDTNTYVVRSYATPIAWRNAAGAWYVVGEKFSPTTGQHVAVVKRALARLGVEV